MNDNFDFKNILVPYNATPGAKRGLHAAINLAAKVDGQITLITCIENPPLSFFKKNKNDHYKKEKEIVAKELEKIEHATKKLKNPIKHTILKSSFAADDIIEYAEKNCIDLVVIGQTKMHRTEAKYHQSMANYLSQCLMCPLMIIK